MSKLGGVGIVNMLIISVFTIILIVGLKAILTNHHVDGLSEIILAA